MGKLNIAHHKSYHPYRRDNIERVRRDEEDARLKEAAEEGRMMLADAEARMDLLRRRAGLDSRRRKDQDETDKLEGPSRLSERQEEQPEAGVSTLTAANGHINLFEGLEQSTMAVPVRSTKAGRGPQRGQRDADEDVRETDKGVALAPSAKDLNPWYSDRKSEKSRELPEDKKLRDIARKSVHDPLTSINTQLASRHDLSSSSSRFPCARHGRAPHSRGRYSETDSSTAYGPPPPAKEPNANEERLSRESSERQRALELIRRRKREAASETPTTVHGGAAGGGYGDVFNRREIEEARRARQAYGRDREWERRR